MAKTDITKVNFAFPAAFMALGGMIYVLATLTAVQAVAAYWEEGRMVEGDNTVKLFFPIVALAVCALVVGLYMRRPGEVDKTYGMYSGGYDASRDFESSNFFTSESFGTMIMILLIIVIAICFISVGADLASFLVSVASTSTIAYFLALLFDKRANIRGAMVGVWFVGYIILWSMGSSHAVSLPIFISFWVVFGSLAGYFLADMIRAENIADKRRAESGDERGPRPGGSSRSSGYASGYSSGYSSGGYSGSAYSGSGASYAPSSGDSEAMRHRRKNTSAKYSEFGRLPQDTTNVLAHLVRRTTGPIASALPVNASSEMTNDTIRLILDTLILDWRVNGNLGGLDDKDVEDLRTFVTCASSFVQGEYVGSNSATYKTVLSFLLKDWLDNWNAEGVDGPPR
ncbi:MAG: hypothetical protein JSS86_12495 [Cyanobacteria bacterium SZAS LIN-2]|nr:hypothetical protein [Cyanobacteria bacterium SZAS LIN-2]